MVGTMQNLVGEVLQAAVGNHFRDQLQSMPAVSFIETRQRVQEEAYHHINKKLSDYEVETLGVYIQDVKFPEQLVVVLTQREIANQQIATYRKQQEAEQQRIDMEKTKGTADKQAELAAATVGVEIKTKNAEADGEATFISQTGTTRGAEIKAIGMARAEAFEKQVNALGKENTALVNMVTVLAEKNLKFVPEIVAGGESGLGGLVAMLMKKLAEKRPEENADQQA
ncbi:SPFH domain-containing protein [Chloroflexota bacterium]